MNNGINGIGPDDIGFRVLAGGAFQSPTGTDESNGGHIGRAATITSVICMFHAGTDVTVQAERWRDGASTSILSTAKQVTVADTATDGGTLAVTDLLPGDWIKVKCTAKTGTVGWVSIAIMGVDR